MTNNSTLVTGAGGFIGGHLARALLDRGECVRAFLHSEENAKELEDRGAEVVIGDIVDKDAIAAAMQDVQVVHHCASAGGTFSDAEIKRINLEGLSNLIDAIDRRGSGRLVLLSGLNALGHQNFESAGEDHPCRHSGEIFGDVKFAAEQSAMQAHRDRGVDVVVLRSATAYGPGDQTIPRLLKAIRKGKFVFLGSRENLVPLVHVDDVVQAMLLAAVQPQASGRLYHIADGSRVTIGQLTDQLAELIGCEKPEKVLPYALPWLGCRVFETLRMLRLYKGRGPINRVVLKFLGTSRHVDISRAKAELGFEPKRLYPDGLEEAVRYAQANLPSSH